MAVNPYQMPTAAGKRFFDNVGVACLRPQNPRQYLLESAARLVRDCPPTLPWASPFRGQVYRGLFLGPTSAAYFFWTLSRAHPDLDISGKKPVDWCKAYIELGQDSVPPLLDTSCGITNEYLASYTIKACLYQDDGHALRILDALVALETDPSYSEWLKGRAGALYLLRVMRQGLPHLAPAIEVVITSLIETIMSQQPWVWDGRQYLGTVHGEIGILTQIVLSDPSYAPKLENKLVTLLGQQNTEGNWPVVDGKEIGLVQFCHGAPGFIVSLLAIRPYFPAVQWQIDAAIALGRRLTWERGLLIKEPNICHGIIGNALALDSDQRDHFLALAIPELVRDGVADGSFEKDWDSFGLLWGEAGRAWVWMQMWDGSLGQGKVVLYSDV
ncbi:hypothetical protein GQ53DRAFT_742225 [Thozetella sp. PMI_491]|nr:hypothetical protein GQ53DRAFT_742225 [Thozetella sp. PMI_491]